MSHIGVIEMPHDPRGGPGGGGPGMTSPLILSDRLLALAQDADRAGLQATADRLVALAHDVFDEPYPVPH